jgi:hypothetical protein
VRALMSADENASAQGADEQEKKERSLNKVTVE